MRDILGRELKVGDECFRITGKRPTYYSAEEAKITAIEDGSITFKVMGQKWDCKTSTFKRVPVSHKSKFPQQLIKMEGVV